MSDIKAVEYATNTEIMGTAYWGTARRGYRRGYLDAIEECAKACGCCGGKGEVYYQDPPEADECYACAPIRKLADSPNGDER